MPQLTRDLLGSDKDLVTGESNNEKRYALICLPSDTTLDVFHVLSKQKRRRKHGENMVKTC